ncbi:MAG: hypothetical protein FJX67_09855 [Alphaproteobacteria bacterium]|nr:hypothetical protein [Alphaproteobacteria bacterium]
MTDAFARMAYRVLVEERKYSAKDVATALGMKYATFHARLIGRVPFRPDEIIALLCAVPDVRIVDALLGTTRFVAVPKVEADNKRVRNPILRNVIDAVSETTKVLDMVGRVQGADRIDDPDLRATLEDHVRAAERALAGLRARLAEEDVPPARASARG